MSPALKILLGASAVVAGVLGIAWLTRPTFPTKTVVVYPGENNPEPIDLYVGETLIIRTPDESTITSVVENPPNAMLRIPAIPAGGASSVAIVAASAGSNGATGLTSVTVLWGLANTSVVNLQVNIAAL